MYLKVAIHNGAKMQSPMLASVQWTVGKSTCTLGIVVPLAYTMRVHDPNFYVRPSQRYNACLKCIRLVCPMNSPHDEPTPLPRPILEKSFHQLSFVHRRVDDAACVLPG